MPPPPRRVKEAPAAREVTGVPELEPYKRFIESKTNTEELKRLFYSELEMGLVTLQELSDRRNRNMAAGRGQAEGFEAAGIKPAIKERIQFEILQHLSEPGYKEALDRALEENDYEFDTGGYQGAFYNKIKEYKEDDIVFFVKRSTTVKLDVACRNCGKKELFMEQPKQTARADEQIVKYARCANCQMRMNAQWLL